MLGGLTLMNLPPDLDADALGALRCITKIAGPLRVSNNAHLTSLGFLAELDTVEAITVTNNANLVDARLPRLTRASLAGTITTALNPRLCAAYRVGDGSNASTATCVGVDLQLQVSCSCNASHPCTDAIAQALNISANRVRGGLSFCT